MAQLPDPQWLSPHDLALELDLMRKVEARKDLRKATHHRVAVNGDADQWKALCDDLDGVVEDNGVRAIPMTSANIQRRWIDGQLD